MGWRNSKTGTAGSDTSAADEAAAWLAALSDCACTDDERRQFAAWLRRSNLHVEEFLRLSVLARQLGSPAPWGDVGAAELIAAARTGSDVVSILPGARCGGRRDNKPRWRWTLAASIAIAALAWISSSEWNTSATTYATERGEQRSITLRDGSVVELNTQSKLRTHFTASVRDVELLQGEAVFKVAKQPQRPFRVVSNASEIVAVGTAFNVDARDSGTVVTVLEGRVRVRHAPRGAARDAAIRLAEYEIELARGEQAVVAPRRPIVRTVLEHPDRATAWTERRLIFEETPLAEATAEFARYHAVKTIRIADPALGRLHISGVFDASDPASLVDFLKAFGGVNVREDEHGWVLLGTRLPDHSFVQSP